MEFKQETIISVFGSGLTLNTDSYFNEVVEIGKLLAENKFVVCCGGYGGTMEAICKGAKSADGKTIGVTLNFPDLYPNEYIDDIVVMENWVERLMELIALGDKYLILSGGSGTLAEISTVLEMMNKHLMKEKKMVFYSDFWKPVIELLKIDSKRMKEVIDRNVFFAITKEDAVKLLV
jgi:uncharacterized protein (TIGR00725 family)